MDGVYIGLFTFLVSAALILLGFYIGSSRGGEMIFKKRTAQLRTRIVHIDKIQDATPAQAIVSSVLHTPRWDVRRGEFRGFDSPLGRF